MQFQPFHPCATVPMPKRILELHGAHSESNASSDYTGHLLAAMGIQPGQSFLTLIYMNMHVRSKVVAKRPASEFFTMRGCSSSGLPLAVGAWAVPKQGGGTWKTKKRAVIKVGWVGVEEQPVCMIAYICHRTLRRAMHKWFCSVDAVSTIQSVVVTAPKKK